MKIRFWFEFASTYSYLAAARIGAISEAAGIEVTWEPFLLGPIFGEQGWKDSPFNLYPAKGDYMWRDMERLCEGHGLPFTRPSSFPRNSLTVARVACLGRSQSWLPDFARAVYHANFAADRDIGDREVVADIVAGLGLPVDETLAQAASDENKAALRQRVEEAKSLGIFGAPSFTVGSELFWGNDRLGDAFAFARIAES